ncbi:MAG: hypothetical protein U9P81_08395, partial [Euryarchaeota archaeon]|nr:hypothetical protein [Euryarchaeota archaeon]
MPEVIRDMGMGIAVASFDRAHEPPGVSTMEWGTRYRCLLTICYSLQNTGARCWWAVWACWLRQLSGRPVRNLIL